MKRYVFNKKVRTPPFLSGVQLVINAIRKEVERSHDDFITEHFRKYNEPELPPVWKTLEVISMGTLSKLYSNFSNATAKHAVAREFGLNHHNFLEAG